MNERLLQFIWQFQYFNRTDLRSVADELVTILAPGLYNTNQGPDFLNARIQIGSATWAGTVELHIKTSDWDRHQHQHDQHYNNVILHVVWEADRPSTNLIPVVVLKGRVPGVLLHRYENMMYSNSFIPCEKMLHAIPDLTWQAWKDRLLVERMLRKSVGVLELLRQNNFHWEETFWWLLARNFGSKINADAFEALARSIPISILAKQRHQIHQLEALLLGQGGLLKDNFDDDYARLLQREYLFLRKKYNLQPIPFPLLYLRMRPGNFPSLRLAQLAMLIYTSAHLFTIAKETQELTELVKYFNVTANDYWHYHYRLGEVSPFKRKNIGQSMIDNVIINSVAPMLFAYGDYHDEQKFKDKALCWLLEMRAETNVVTAGFGALGIKIGSAYDSQALIELKNQYCDSRRCLDCGVGMALLKQGAASRER
ncbi:MAG: DUF2851 family protein [Chitinophagaceae bacterium]|nr:DUF2851 family protein [Chitinophagaceae bacterium]